MTPSQISKSLYKIAEKIDSSKNPSKDLVLKDLKQIISSMTRLSTTINMNDFELVHPAMDQFAQAVESWGNEYAKNVDEESIPEVKKIIQEMVDLISDTAIKLSELDSKLLKASGEDMETWTNLYPILPRA